MRNVNCVSTVTQAVTTARLATILVGLLALVSTASAAYGQLPDERQLEIKASPEMPLKLAAVRNLQDATFLDRLEIEVQNTATKPIYYIHATVVFPDLVVEENGRRYGFPIYFGNLRLLKLDRRAAADDESIAPGNTYVFNIPELMSKGLQEYVTKYNTPLWQLKRIRVSFDVVSFGDGTGVKDGKTQVDTNASPSLQQSTKRDVDNSLIKRVSLRSRRLRSGPPQTPGSSDKVSSNDFCATGCDGKYDQSDTAFCGVPPHCPHEDLLHDVSQPCKIIDYYSYMCEGLLCSQGDVFACDSCGNACPSPTICSGGHCISPIIIDLSGRGIRMTNGKRGVEFDITDRKALMKISWTEARSRNAWLVLDRNGNGVIDSGAELFGTFTPRNRSDL